MTACQNTSESEGASSSEETTATEQNVEQTNENASNESSMDPEKFDPMDNIKEVTDKELEQFATALKEVQAENIIAQQKMMEAVQKTGFDFEQFNSITKAMDNPELTPDATDEELARVKAAVEELEKIRTETNQLMIDKIRATGLTEVRYQQVGQAMQDSEVLQAKFQELMLPPSDDSEATETEEASAE